MSVVYYLGPEGTFSHILARRRFGPTADLRPCATFHQIFEETAAHPGAFGLVPVENSSGGTVYDCVDLLIGHAGRVFVQEELSLDVRIALLGHPKGPVRTIYSHFTQLKHHAAWLRERYPQAAVKETTSTALACQMAKGDRAGAALASPGAADVYGLTVREKPARSREVNVTHFYVIQSTPPTAEPAGGKTALVAALPNQCGSLHRFLGPFARQKVSLSRIVSRPVPGQPQTYVFFVEIVGGPADPAVRRALARAKTLSATLTTLGTFPIGRRFRS